MVVVVVTAIAGASAQAIEAEQVKSWPLVRAIGFAAGTAVVQHLDGSMVVVRAGDELEGHDAVVAQVLENRLELDETVVDEITGSKVRRVVWLYLAHGSPPVSEARLVERRGQAAELIRKPIVVDVPLEDGQEDDGDQPNAEPNAEHATDARDDQDGNGR